MKTSQLAALGALLFSVPLFAQGGAEPQPDGAGPGAPLLYEEIVARARVSPDLLATEALLADARRALSETQRRLREGASLGAATGPRRGSRGAVTADQAVDLDLPLFLDAPARREAEEALGRSADILRTAPRLELAHRLRQAYLDAWLEARVLALRTLDLATVENWRKAAQARFEAGADPALQVSLVEGEILRARLEVEEARQRTTEAWGALLALADLPSVPQPLADPGEPGLPQGALPGGSTDHPNGAGAEPRRSQAEPGELAARFASGTLTPGPARPPGSGGALGPPAGRRRPQPLGGPRRPGARG